MEPQDNVSTSTKNQPWKAFMATHIQDSKRKPDTTTENIRLKYQADDGSLGG